MAADLADRTRSSSELGWGQGHGDVGAHPGSDQTLLLTPQSSVRKQNGSKAATVEMPVQPLTASPGCPPHCQQTSGWPGDHNHNTKTPVYSFQFCLFVCFFNLNSAINYFKIMSFSEHNCWIKIHNANMLWAILSLGNESLTYFSLGLINILPQKMLTSFLS